MKSRLYTALKQLKMKLERVPLEVTSAGLKCLIGITIRTKTTVSKWFRICTASWTAVPAWHSGAPGKFSECAIELGAFADARLSIIKWRRNDFEHLATPANDSSESLDK